MKHCFVIDDSDVVRRYTRLIFESLGYRVSEASDPPSALGRLGSESPDLFLVDWRIPGFDMHEFISQLRRMPLEKRPVIIYVPTEHDVVDVQRAIKLGADTFLLKPFNLEIIEMKLHEIRIAA